MADLLFKVTPSPEGAEIVSLWTDKIDLLSLGHAKVVRASHVEFCNTLQAWVIFDTSMKPIPGQPSGGFAKRADALMFEVEWAHGEIRAGREKV